MAGVKGRSGGARPGAGRKPKPKAAPAEVKESDMLRLLQQIAMGQVNATPIQVRAAIAAVQYTHTKRADGGKKEEAAGKAKEAAGGRFGARPRPLKLVGNA
jgi:hypothetical protein